MVEYFNMSGFKVEGDTVTLVFEMRSGREHNTPDRAIWGFKVESIIIYNTASFYHAVVQNVRFYSVFC